eukprot:TRINITY_DN68087_c6_g1_i2.p2 TRINITY_DN68087_c6_g1~~TRINITY_DN68087_c6_g1_i2.p2  ORF type:complete len:104 (-),score=7.44 TRINITY_DN68087_c6_g1_i2:162-473(-)
MSSPRPDSVQPQLPIAATTSTHLQAASIQCTASCSCRTPSQELQQTNPVSLNSTVLHPTPELFMTKLPQLAQTVAFPLTGVVTIRSMHPATNQTSHPTRTAPT